jgi:penicillin-binding protein 2
VKSVDGETENDTLLHKYNLKHEVLTHIPEDEYEVVASGMQDVTEIGTAQIARIPGINMCAKTGTAENYLVIEHRKTKLKNHSIFVCFAPRENPKIAVAVVISNAGFGATWAAPIGSLLVEKYLNDSLRAQSQKKVEEISATNLMPKYLVRLQFVADSVRAANRARQDGDSTNYMKYINPQSRARMLDTLGRYNNIPLTPPVKNPIIKPKNKIKVPKDDSLTR